ncbi:hypothetical protein HII31_03633 [Pseudocercospora fuligena]|uniref:Uncharacterized protein n=1 Tax=Pseudocercospora fuligena TaxID=685502 RepID=A0A8H6RPT5_9PEZI|nr:hypothetical protein HII31_03633 [Pseudocercospora fuligena]
MEENTQDHDFDQRHDGPYQETTRPSIQLDTLRSPSSKSMPEKGHINEKDAARSPSTPSAPPRKSVQFDRNGLDREESDSNGLPRRSTQMSRTGAGRPSRDFDNRRDGPYGRPSITMARRRSSQGLPIGNETDPRASFQDPTAPDVEALQHLDTMTAPHPDFEPEPPSLNYDLWSRRWYIAFFWSLILVDCIAMPIVLYFCLWYLTDLSPNAVFSIVTAALGGVSIVEYFVRFWRLWKKDSTCRVIGARRAYLDWFHWNFSLGWIVIMIELIVGTVPEHPPIRLLAMPLASMLYAFGTELLIVDTLRYFEVPAPCRMSSIPKGAQLRPAIYSMIEDVVAVDGSGGTEYREALNRRYEASHMFRAMLRRLGIFWAVGAEGMAVVTTIIVFTIQHEAAYVVGWSAPFVWAGIWVIVTIAYVKYCLKKEKKAWAEEIAEKQAAANGNGSETTEVPQPETTQ